MKPSEIIKIFVEVNRERYAGLEIDTRNIATVLNVVMKIGEILDQHENRIERAENGIQGLKDRESCQ